MLSNPLYFFSSGTTTETPGIPSSEAQCRLSDIMDYFFVARPESGRKECYEHLRVMYFFPKHEDMNKQVEVTGFAEAVVNFTDNFVETRSAALKPEFPFRTVTTKKFEKIFIQVEDGEFIVGISLIKAHCQTLDFPIFLPAIRNVLANAYKMFRLFFGSFSSYRAKNEEKFKERLDYFFNRYIPLQKLYKMPILDYLEGAAFLPLQGPAYLNIVNLMAELCEEFPQISKILFLYQDKVLYYTTSVRDLPTVFRYLTQSLLPMSIGPELEPDTSRSNSHGRFLRGPADLNSDAPLQGDDALPTVHLFCKFDDDEDETLHRYQMMTYRSLNATVCLFVRGEVSRRLMRNVDSALGADLSRLASLIGDSVDSQSLSREKAPPSDFHYVYFNPCSLSLTSSFSDPSHGYQPPTPPSDVSRLLCETLKGFISEEDEFGECFVKADSEWWIVLKKMNSRLLCLLLPPSSTHHSLADVQYKVQLIVKSSFEAIFFN